MHILKPCLNHQQSGECKFLHILHTNFMATHVSYNCIFCAYFCAYFTYMIYAICAIYSTFIHNTDHIVYAKELHNCIAQYCCTSYCTHLCAICLNFIVLHFVQYYYLIEFIALIGYIGALFQLLHTIAQCTSWLAIKLTNTADACFLRTCSCQARFACVCCTVHKATVHAVPL